MAIDDGYPMQRTVPTHVEMQQQVASPGCKATATDVHHDTDITAALVELGMAIEQFEALAPELEARFAEVLENAPCAKDAPEKVAYRTTVLGRRIEDYTNRLNAVGHALAGVCGRCAL